jgi:ferredoxin-type protein NapG
MSMSRRDLLGGRLRALLGGGDPPAPEPQTPPAPAPDRAEVPPEVAARAARFRAEVAARPRSEAPGPLPAVVAWLLDPEPEEAVPAALLRPPGAIEELAFRAGCTRCGDCARACPYGAIQPAPDRAVGAAGTPILQPETAACLMCPDTPCISACEPRVLRAELPRRVGTAVPKPQSCLNAVGAGGCTVCVERCPEPGAIAIEAGRVRVDAERCTGCGVCVYACPAPSRALVVLPLAERPPAPPPEIPS